MGFGRAVMFLFVGFAVAGCERHALDKKMQELCHKDGGVKVYETVTLSASDFDALKKYSKERFRENYYGPDYRLVENSKILAGEENGPQQGKGRLKRFYSAIYRRSDGRLLGESVLYGRTGGDGFTFGFQPSSNICPRPRADLGQAIFLKGE